LQLDGGQPDGSRFFQARADFFYAIGSHLQKRVPVSYAVAVGTRWVNLPVIPLMFAPVCLWMLLLAQFSLEFVIAWFWWSYMVPRWCIWAYEGVDDIAALKARAVQG